MLNSGKKKKGAYHKKQKPSKKYNLFLIEKQQSTNVIHFFTIMLFFNKIVRSTTASYQINTKVLDYFGSFFFPA